MSSLLIVQVNMIQRSTHPFFLCMVEKLDFQLRSLLALVKMLQLHLSKVSHANTSLSGVLIMSHGNYEKVNLFTNAAC